MNGNIKPLKNKIRALQTEGVLLVMSDFYEIVRQTVWDNTGMQLKQNDTPLEVKNIIEQLEAMYVKQLSEALAKENTTTYRQKDLLEEIEELKQ